MKIVNIDKVSSFSICYDFFDENRETELKMLVNGKNILAFMRDNQKMTAKWNLDEIALWLRSFIDNLSEDPYPVMVEGEYAAIRDIFAREFDTDDEDEFDVYYDKLDEWNRRHRWHTESKGAILADLYFQLVGEFIEISWNNVDAEEGVIFDFKLGGTKISKDLFCKEMESFLKDYANHWFRM